MASSVDFSEETIRRIFGHEAAEDEDGERLREYYLKSSTYEQVTANLPLRILVGHKGVGKSALFQVAMADDRDANRLTLVVQPDDIADMAEDTHDFLKTVRAWKIGLGDLLAKKALTGLGFRGETVPDLAKRWSGKLTDYLMHTIKDPKLVSLDPTKKAITQSFLDRAEISVYIDDLDRGWQGRKQDITRISALLNAVRDISNENKNIRFRLALRTDVYFLVRTSDESTDKIEGSVVWQRWTQQEIFALLALRIDTYLGRDINRASYSKSSQGYLSHSLDQLFDAYFSGEGHWKGAPTHRVLMSLIRKRPRDLVKLCTLAAQNAKISGNDHITSQNLKNIFEDYSQGRMQDTINEYRTELPQIERLLFGMKPSKKERTAKAGYTYETSKLLTKIKSIQEQGAFKFANSKVASTKDLAAFLYKINFITARKDSGSTIERRYFEESRYLQASFVDFGFDWEVHPAYRWALQPENMGDIFAQLKLSSDAD
ncbi:P-loop ATPase, Sll1717 family [Okibacterium fritillariae]|uniref:P-loop ATPase, Sll1717 family n=1 Tax=Okibacterium fritillariae TaxID=123320 RepID=UPI00405543F0